MVNSSNIRWWNCELCFIDEGNYLLKSASGRILTNDLTDGSPLLLGVHSILWSCLRFCGSFFTDVCCVGRLIQYVRIFNAELAVWVYCEMWSCLSSMYLIHTDYRIIYIYYYIIYYKICWSWHLQYMRHMYVYIYIRYEYVNLENLFILGRTVHI